MKTKVTDEQILDAIWRAQVKRTARGVIDAYIGGGKAIKPSSKQWRFFAQAQFMISRGSLGLPLSKGHLSRRLKGLIGMVPGLEWDGIPGNAYWFNTAQASLVFDYASDWWAERGVPSGYDADTKRVRTVPVDDFEAKVAMLEAELVERFGGSSQCPTP